MKQFDRIFSGVELIRTCACRAILSFILFALVSNASLNFSYYDANEGQIISAAKIKSGNISMSLFLSANASEPFYSRSATIINGTYNLYPLEVPLSYGQRYWKSYWIIGDNLSYGSQNRIPFYSCIGEINESYLVRSINLNNATGYSYMNLVDAPSITEGPPGPQGEQGPQGPQGYQGEQGIQGVPGANGDKGDKGDTGSQGPQGEPGMNGSNGSQGIQGDPGSPGAKGDAGAQGTQGEPGLQGIPGINGTNGLNGINGLNGSNANVSCGDTFFVCSYSNPAYVNITQNQTTFNTTTLTVCSVYNNTAQIDALNGTITASNATWSSVYNASYMTNTFNTTYDAKPSNTFNSTYAALVTDNASWNETSANAKYATQNTTVARTGTCPANQWGTASTTSGLTCAQPSTSNLTEGASLFYTDARAQATRASNFSNNTVTTCARTTATTVGMMGFRQNYTTKAGNTSRAIMATLNFQITSPATASLNSQWQPAYGTGTAPACNAAATGTVRGNLYNYSTDVAVMKSSPQSVTFIISGLAASTTYWFDLQVIDSSTASWAYSKPQLVVFEY